MTESIFGLAGKNVLVVGGGQGMGESTSEILASVGCNVAVLDVEISRAEAVAERVRSFGVKAVALAANVIDDDDLLAAIAAAEDELGGLDGMVSIVGGASFASLLEMTSETWEFDHQRNLRYFWVAAQDVARRMIGANRKGAIVALASVDGIQSAPYHAAYGAAKAGLIGLVKSMAAEWTELGVRVNVIAPGAIATPRIPRRSEEEERERYGSIPARRRGDVSDIGKAALFLVSDLSSYISGQTLAVDGGFTAVGPVDYRADAARAGVGGTLGGAVTAK